MFNQKTLSVTALVWVPLSIIYIVGIGFTYIATQQNYRQSLNDPQVQVTEEAAAMIKSGQATSALVPTERIDIANSLSPFIIFYADNYKVIDGSGTLHNAIPTPPTGVFRYVDQHGENRVTWQPQKNIRIAAVIRKTTNGYVLAGRSMREGEAKITMLASMTAATLLLGLGLSLGATLMIAHLHYRKHS